MELICLNCKKTYKINPKKIPPNIKTAKCKACGHTILLKSEPSKRMPAQSNAHKITCLYCSRKYTYDVSKIPPNMSTVKCKVCGHSISLKQTTALATNPQSNTNKITCLYCSKTYMIDRSKIPDGVSTTTCKSCGHTISLKPKHASIIPPKAELKSTGAYLNPPKVAKLNQPISQLQQQPYTPLWKKPWLLAAVFAMIVLGVTVMYTNIDFMKFLGGQSAKEQIAKPARQHHITHLPKPFLKLNINVPLALASLEKHIPKEKKDLTYTTTVSAINSLNVNRIQLYLFPDSTHTVLSVMLVHGSNNKSLETRVKKVVAIKTMLERMPDGSYRLKKEAMSAEKQNDYCIDLYRIHLSDQGAVIAPKSLLPELKNTEILQHTQVAQMAASVETSRDLAVLAIRIPENLQAGWEKKIKELPGLKQNPQMAMMAAMGGEILSQMTEPLEKIEAMALGFRFNGDTGRTLSYAQIFRKGVDGAKVYQQLNSGDTDDADVDGIVWNLIEIFKDPRYRQQIRFNDNRLALDFTWSETDDKDFFTALSEATIGQLMFQSMQLEPTEGPLITQYTDEPQLVASVNVDKLKKTVTESVRKSIFPGNYFDFGDNPHMTLDMDTVDIPNAALAEKSMLSCK